MPGSRFQGDLPDRTFEFAVSVLERVKHIPDGTLGWVVGKQLARSGGSVGANVHEAEHALTAAEFTNRCSIARREPSETFYWLRICARVGLLSESQTTAPSREAEELLKILSSIVKKTQASTSARR